MIKKVSNKINQHNMRTDGRWVIQQVWGDILVAPDLL